MSIRTLTMCGVVCGVVCAMTISSAVSAQTAGGAGSAQAPLTVSTAWLAEHVNDRNLVVLHVGGKAAYDSGHVAGSRHVTLDDVAQPSRPGGLTLQMADEAQLDAWAERNGIGDDTRIVVVPHDTVLQSATRVFFTLAYLGAMDRTSLLDGSFQAWKREGRPISTEAPAAASGVRFTPRLRPELIATLAQVEAITKDGSTHLIDARLPRFYQGNGGGYPRPGHIPTAVNVPLSTVSSNGYLKPAAELRQLFVAQGVDGSKPVVTYCHIGQQATLLWFVASLLGHEVRMFDGSFQEWSGVAPPTCPWWHRPAPARGSGSARRSAMVPTFFVCGITRAAGCLVPGARALGARGSRAQARTQRPPETPGPGS